MYQLIARSFRNVCVNRRIGGLHNQTLYHAFHRLLPHLSADEETPISSQHVHHKIKPESHTEFTINVNENFQKTMICTCSASQPPSCSPEPKPSRDIRRNWHMQTQAQKCQQFGIDFELDCFGTNRKLCYVVAPNRLIFVSDAHTFTP